MQRRSKPWGWHRLLVAALCVASAGCAPGMGAGPSSVAGSEAGIPVLTWHGFSERPATRGNLTETYARFEEMLVFLERHGFRSVFPDQVRPGDDRRRMVVLTFDDGTVEQLRAAEIMERHGFRGIFFVIPERARRHDARFLDSTGVSRLARAGHRIAPHGWAHRSMAAVPDEVERSLHMSADTLARQAGQPPADADFAFPFGHYTASVVPALASRYRYLHTVEPGYWDGVSPLLPRMLVMTDVDLRLFEDYVLRGARYRPVLRPLVPSGSVGDSVAFLAPRGWRPRDVQLFAVSADAQGRSYVPHPVGDALRMRGDTAWLNAAAYMGRYHVPGRIALSYALVVRDGRGVRYLTPGLLHWLRDPAAAENASVMPGGRPPAQQQPAPEPRP